MMFSPDFALILRVNNKIMLSKVLSRRIPTLLRKKNERIFVRHYCPTPSTPMKPVAVQLWEIEQAKKLGSSPPKISYEEKDELFDHPLYSPIPKVNTGTTSLIIEIILCMLRIDAKTTQAYALAIN